MEDICIVSDSLKTHNHLRPLMNCLREDAAMDVTLLSLYRLKIQGIDLYTATLENNEGQFSQAVPPGTGDCLRTYFTNAYKLVKPEMVMVYGSSHIAFSAAVAAAIVDIPVAHIQGGESDAGLWDDTLGFGISKISHLHFTSTETYRRRVIGFGEHPERVFNVGALSAGRKVNSGTREKIALCRKFGLDPDREILFVSMVPDRALGSKNRALTETVMAALADPRFNRFSVILQDPGPKGFGMIMRHEMEAFASAQPGRVGFIDSESEIITCLGHARAVVGNTGICAVDAALYSVGAVSVGGRLKGRDNPGHMKEAQIDAEAVIKALEQVLCPLFGVNLMCLALPFERTETPGLIKNIVKAYSHLDTAPKADIRF